MCLHMYIILISPCIKDMKKVTACSSEYLKSEIFLLHGSGQTFPVSETKSQYEYKEGYYLKIRVMFCVFHLTLLYVCSKYFKKK